MRGVALPRPPLGILPRPSLTREMPFEVSRKRGSGYREEASLPRTPLGILPRPSLMREMPFKASRKRIKLDH